MSLVRFLPTPSDRMGIIWSLLAVQGAIVLEYGLRLIEANDFEQRLRALEERSRK